MRANWPGSLRAGELTEIYIPEPTDDAIRDLCRARSDAVDDRSRGCGIIGSKRFSFATGIVTREKAPGAQRTNDHKGRTIWIVDRHRGDGEAFRCACRR